MEYVKTPVETKNLYDLKQLTEKNASDLNEEIPFTRFREMGNKEFYQEICKKYDEPTCLKLTNALDFIAIGISNNSLVLYDIRGRVLRELKTKG
jgi:hypothetical protein